MLAPAPLPTEAAPTKWHDVTVVCKKTYERACVVGVAPEEFGISSSARSIKDAGYAYHELVDKSESDLIEQGYDSECIKGLPSYSGSTNIEEQSRNTVDETGSSLGDDGFNPANRKIKITEHYVKMDYEGDGKARLYRVTTGGNDGVILTRDGEDDVVEVDHICFAAMTPVIVTHRFFGRSIADLVMDIQRIKTALLRGLLDNLYLHNNPRTEIAESHASDSTLDDLLVSRPGGIVRTKIPGGLSPFQTPDITGSVYPALQYMDAQRDWRTGVSRQGQGVDPDALQNQVATIANQMEDASQAKVKLIARIFAETGIRDLFSLLHATIRRHGSQPQTVRLRNKWVNVDPREWKSRQDMTIQVGLGSGNKTQQLAATLKLAELQTQGVAVGLVSPKNLFNTAKKYCKLIGEKDPELYFTSPGGQPDPNDPSSAPIPPPPDPKMMEVQAKVEMQKFDAQKSMMEMQGKAEIEKTQAQADIATSQMKTQADIALAREKFELEKQLKLIDAALKQQEHARDLQQKDAMHGADMMRSQEKHMMGMEQAKEKASQKAEMAPESKKPKRKMIRRKAPGEYEMTEE